MDIHTYAEKDSWIASLKKTNVRQYLTQNHLTSFHGSMISGHIGDDEAFEFVVGHVASTIALGVPIMFHQDVKKGHQNRA